MYGHAGKILHLKLSDLSYEVIDTEKYREWGGGHGLGTALFWDLCKDKTLTDGRHEKNVVVVASSPFSGTTAPAAGGRCEVTGIGYGQVPVSWYTRSNFGGRFSATMKFAGWDAVVISGRAEKPVWVDVRDDRIEFRPADNLWGRDTRATQLDIFKIIEQETGQDFGGWRSLPAKGDATGYTTQKPAVLCIGPAGENQSMMSSLIHDAGNGAGQGGFGAVWGFKNLKAISLHGTGSVRIADPAAMLQARFKEKELYGQDYENADFYSWGSLSRIYTATFVGLASKRRRTQACQGCVSGCRSRYDIGYGNEVSCQETSWYGSYASRYYKGKTGKIAQVGMKVAQYCNMMGVNSYPLEHGLDWLEKLWHEGLLGPGKKIHTDLDFGRIGSLKFAKELLDCIALKKDIGKDLAEGFVPTAIKWGRKKDWDEGELLFPYWGMPEHGYDPRAEVEWGFASIMTDRDINSHDFNLLFWKPTISVAYGMRPRISAEDAARLVADKLKPYVDGPECIDYSDGNIYSDAVLNLVRWFLRYSRFWKNSALLCDLRWADLFDTNAPDNIGATAHPEVGEQVYWNAITGENISFVDGLERGYKIWYLDNAIWTLQGRHRDMAVFADYIFDKKMSEGEFFPFYFWPCRDKDGSWAYRDVMHRHLDRKKFEEWKTRFYLAEGCDPETGWPIRSTLEKLGLVRVADELKKHEKLGEEPA